MFPGLRRLSCSSHSARQSRDCVCPRLFASASCRLGRRCGGRTAFPLASEGVKQTSVTAHYAEHVEPRRSRDQSSPDRRRPQHVPAGGLPLIPTSDDALRLAACAASASMPLGSHGNVEAPRPHAQGAALPEWGAATTALGAPGSSPDAEAEGRREMIRVPSNRFSMSRSRVLPLRFSSRPRGAAHLQSFRRSQTIAHLR